ncbi:MAG: type II secretion system protein GspD, partial [Fidelibacterota bacterium]
YVIQDNILIVKPVDTEMAGETITRVYQLDYISATDLITPLEDILTPKGTIQIFQRSSELSQNTDQETGTRADELVVTDVPSNFESIETLIQQLDVPIPQVMISVKFIETILSDNENMGIDWTAKATLQGGPAQSSPTGLVTAGGGGGTAAGGTGGTTGGGGGGGAAAGLGIGKFKQLNLAILTLQEFQVVLDYLRSSGNSKVLSDPRIATLDNHRATFTTETELTVIVPTVSQGATGALATETAEKYTIKIELVVLPHVHKNGQITMVVEPTVEGITGYSGPKLDQPIISRRNAQTQVRVNNGETIAMGGLIKEDVRELEKKVPFLGDIPLIGKLFTYHSSEKQKSDLLIFITPHLVYSDNKTE